MKVLVALPSVGRLTGLNVVNTLRDSLTSHGHTPVFYFGINRQDATQEFKRKTAKHRDIQLALITKRGQGAGTLAAIKMGLREKPDAILTLPDDYELEAKHMHKLVAALETHEVAIGNWDKTSWRTFPTPQYLNEMHASALVTYASPHFKPRNPNVGATALQAKPRGQAIQTYTGMYAFTPQAWRKIERELKRFKPQHIANAGIEAAITLAAIHTRQKIKQPKVPRRFEHEVPTEETSARHRETRLRQFQDATEVVKSYLQRTGQTKKIPHVDAYASKVEEQIKTRPILRRGQKPIPRAKVSSAMHLK